MNSAFNSLFLRSADRDDYPTQPDYPASLRIGDAKPKREKKSRYSVNLAEQMAQYEINYARLLKLLPNLDQQDAFHFAVDHGNTSSELCVRVVDRAPYTTTLEIEQLGKGCDWARAPQLTVCLYHDADMAEVTAWEDHRRLKPRYEYPNKRMYHRDEKSQLNQFLSDWLQVYERHGRVNAEWMAPVGR